MSRIAPSLILPASPKYPDVIQTSGMPSISKSRSKSLKSTSTAPWTLRRTDWQRFGHSPACWVLEDVVEAVENLGGLKG